MSKSEAPSDPSPGPARWQQQLSAWLSHHDVPRSGVVMMMALLGGISTGFAAVLFRRLITGVQFIAFHLLDPLWQPITPLHLILIPAAGGLIVGLLVTHGAPEARGAGIPEVMEAVAMRGGRIHPRVTLIKPLAAAICIGSGGSVGREGPIVQIGSALGSHVSQFFRLNDEQTRTLVACGAAGGIAATFNAPIAGSIFALEVILGQFHVIYFGAVVVSAVVADVIAQVLEGNVRAFTVPSYTALLTPWELPLYALLGGIAGVLAVFFIHLLSRAEDRWLRVPLPAFARPALGGALLGVLGILSWRVDGIPRIFGVGYGTIDNALFGELGVGVALALLLLKFVATALTLASGGSGGVFAPSLFMGAMLGAAYGRIVHQLLPAITAPAGAYALVGMAAFVSGTTHTPVTAILILFEMTGDYKIILPLMLATVLSTIVARTLYQESIYTEKLRRRGVHWEQAQHIDVMRGVSVAEAMTTNVDTISLDLPLTELTAEFERTHHHGFPILDDEGLLTGIVSLSDLDRALAEGPITGKIVADIATTTGLIVAYPDEPMWVALRRLGQYNISRLPVLQRPGSRRVVGLVRRSDIVRAYNKAMIKRAREEHKIELLRLGKMDGVSLVHFDIMARSPVAGKQVKEVDLPEGCLLVSVRRGHKLHVVHGYTTLQEGDTIAIMAEDRHLPQIEQKLLPQFTKALSSRPRRVRHYELIVPAGANCSGRSVRELNLPDGCILVSVTRNEEAIVPHGDTVIEAGDVIELFGVVDDIETAVDRLSQCGFRG